MTNMKKRYYPIRTSENPERTITESSRNTILVPITEEQYRSIYRKIWSIRKNEQDNGRCMCPKKLLWTCDGMCLNCEFHVDNKVISLDKRISTTNDNDLTLLDVLADSSIDTGDFVAEALVCKQLLKRLVEFMPKAKEIGRLRLDGLSDQAIAQKLGIPRTTMLSQLKKALQKIIQEFPEFKF